jgi:hypothetical protein
MDGHVRSKDAARDRPIHFHRELCAEFVKNLFCSIGRRGFDEGGAISFFGAGVQSKLANDQQRSANILDRSIHCAVFIGKYPQTENFAG